MTGIRCVKGTREICGTWDSTDEKQETGVRLKTLEEIEMRGSREIDFMGKTKADTHLKTPGGAFLSR